MEVLTVTAIVTAIVTIFCVAIVEILYRGIVKLQQVVDTSTVASAGGKVDTKQKQGVVENSAITNSAKDVTKPNRMIDPPTKTTGSESSDEGGKIRRKALAFPGDSTKDSTIDESDFLAVKKILLESGHGEHEISTRVREVVKIRKNDVERRVYKLEMKESLFRNLTSLPPSVGELENLECLSLRNLEVTSLPPSIGKLQNLVRLDLCSTKLTSLPEEIGNLTSLTRIDLSLSKIRSLPPSFGRLRNLKELDLFFTTSLSRLPQEIGDLVSLEKLVLNESTITSLPCSIGGLINLKFLNLSSHLTASKISSLPPSIGRLHSLKDLDLSYTKRLKDIPQEIGDLANLEKLNLYESNIRSLPPTIGRLQNLRILNISCTDNLFKLPIEIGKLQRLENLDLSCAENLSTLPEEIGNLANLKILDLQASGITSLPRSFGRLASLMYLNIHGTHIPELKKYPNDFLLILVKRCRSLGCLGKESENGREKLRFSLACNRSRHRTPFGIPASDAVSVQTTSKLWPRVIQNSTRAFKNYPDPGWAFNSSSEYHIQQTDAIYQLLVDGRESFVGVLVNRNTNVVSRVMSA